MVHSLSNSLSLFLKFSAHVLSKFSKSTIGCDLSEEMLKQAAKNKIIEFIKSPAESLPFENDEFDFVNISMGFHWLEQRSFLDEAKRVLGNNGYLCIDNYGFSGKISQDSMKQKVHSDFFNENLPAASRRVGYPSEDMLKEKGMTVVEEFLYDHIVELSSDEFINLIMTWSNFQIKSEKDKEETFQKMQNTYQKIFDGCKLPLEFKGKAILYSFGNNL